MVEIAQRFKAEVMLVICATLLIVESWFGCVVRVLGEGGAWI
jgi:hypothetical protein